MERERKIAVFDGDPVIGRALVLLLQTMGYRVSFLGEDVLDEVGSLEDVALLLLAPGWSASVRGELLKALNGSVERVPLLELGVSEEGESHPERFVPWPCRNEELKRCIDEALYYAPEPREEKDRTWRE